MSWLRRLLHSFLGTISEGIRRLQNRLHLPEDPVIEEMVIEDAAVEAPSRIEHEEPRFRRLSTTARTVASAARGTRPFRHARKWLDRRRSHAEPQVTITEANSLENPAAPLDVPVLADIDATSIENERRPGPADWRDNASSIDRDDSIERVCRRHARRAVANTQAASEGALQFICFEVAHEIALHHGRTTLLDVSMEDLVRAANETLIDLRRFGVAAVTLEQVIAVLSVAGDIKKANQMRYFANIGSSILSLTGGPTALGLGRLAMHLGAPRLLAPQRAKNAFVVYFVGKMSHRLYAVK